MEHPSSLSAQTSDSIKSSALVALTVGVLVWLVAIALTPKLAEGDFFTVLPRFWLFDFLLGGFVTILLLSVFALRGGINAADFFAACAAYFLPASIVVVAGETFASVFTYAPARETLQADGAIMVPLMYGLGLVLAWWHLLRKKKDFLVGFILPPTVMVCVLLGFWAVRLFASDAFVYRDAFWFGTRSVTLKDRVLTATATLRVQKPGDYRYSATPVPSELMADGSEQIPEIEWTETKTPPGQPGEYAVVLTWRNVELRDVTSDPSLVGFGPCFQVNRKVGDREQLLRSFMVPVAAPNRL